METVCERPSGPGRQEPGCCGTLSVGRTATLLVATVTLLARVIGLRSQDQSTADRMTEVTRLRPQKRVPDENRVPGETQLLVYLCF